MATQQFAGESTKEQVQNGIRSKIYNVWIDVDQWENDHKAEYFDLRVNHRMQVQMTDSHFINGIFLSREGCQVYMIDVYTNGQQKQVFHIDHLKRVMDKGSADQPSHPSTSKPRSQAPKRTKKPAQPKQPEPEQRQRTKREMAREIMSESEGLRRKDIIERFMSELDMSKAGASTYYYQVKNQV